MATTPYFLWPAQPSSAAASDAMSVFAFSAQEETPAAATAPMDVEQIHAPELSEAVARPRLRRQASSGSGSGRQQAASGNSNGGGGTPKKPPQRGLGVAELERLRCGGVDPLQDLNVAAAAAMLEAAAAASAQGSSVFLHHQHDRVPAFDAATGARYYSPLLVRPPPALPAPPQAPVRYVHRMAPDQHYFMDHTGGFVRAGGDAGAGGVGHMQLLQAQAPAPEQPSSQNTIWRPASSPPSCLHAGHRCDLCSKTMAAFTERGSRAPAPTPAATTTTTMPDYSIHDLAAAMTAARKDAAGDAYLVREGKKEVREIEFFPTSTANHAEESQFATAMRRTPPFPSSSHSPGVGGYAAPLDLSLRL